MNNRHLHTALIGHTGFVGSNLHAQGEFTDCYNSRNIADIAGRDFDAIICAGVQAVKWKANKDPEADWAGIEKLLGPLRTVTARRFILISTIDVYANPSGETEDVAPSQENHAYGRHRAAVEAFVREHFASHHIVRLPGLFGDGLKKNVIYDLLHDNCLDLIQPRSSFQYYHLKHLTADLRKAVDHGIRLLNLATGPVTTQSIIENFAPGKMVGEKAGPAVSYDFRSKHAALWGGRDGYLYDAATVLHEIGEFMEAERKKG